MLLPIASSIIAASVYYIELKNETFINWVSYSDNDRQLFFPKFIVSLTISFMFSFFNLIAILLFYIINGASLPTLSSIFFSFTVINIITILIVNVLTITIINITKNFIVSIVTGIVITMISMIFMAASFSYIFPTTFSYRLGLMFLDSAFYYENINSTLILGLTISVIVFILFSVTAYKTLRYKSI